MYYRHEERRRTARYREKENTVQWAKDQKNRRLLKGVEFVEQIENKETVAASSCHMERKGSSRKTEGGGKEENVLTENIETKSDAKLKRRFRLSFKRANAGFIAWCALMVIMLICLSLVMATGAQWIALLGAGAFLLGIPAIFLALAAQTSNQAVRIDAKFKGKDKDFFKEDEKECSLSKTAAECYGFVKRVFNRVGNESKHEHSRYEVKHIQNRRTARNARSCRRAPRPAFAHSSHDGGGGDGSDDSGDSDQGDPPGPSHHTAPLKLSQFFYRKSNSTSYRRRFLYALRYWRVSCGKRSGGRWAE
jgi:hypothetical protein